MIKSGSATIVSAGARLVGELVADEEIILAGSLEGSIRTSRSVQVAGTGHVQGEIQAESVTVLGRVTGPIRAADRIELQAGALVEGDIEAQRVRIHEEAVFNGHCRITGGSAMRRQYLLPAVVHSFDADASPQALSSVEKAAEGLLREVGFEVEVRPDPPEIGEPALHPIYRSREALPYGHLRERLRSVETALQSAATPEPSRRLGVLPRRPDRDSEPLQTTGADAARTLVEALAQLHNGALLVGPVILTRIEDERGPHLTVRVRQDVMPPESVPAVGAPDPSALLVSLQKAQNEVVRDLAGSIVARGRRARAG